MSLQTKATGLRAKMPFMQWRVNIKRFGPFLAYVLLVVVILTSAVVLGRYNRSKKLEAPSKSQGALKAELNEIALVVNGVAAADGKQDTIASELARTENELKSSIESARGLADSNKSDLGQDKYNSIVASLDQQQSLLNTYQSRFKLVGKAVQYNPSLDLESLDPNDSQQLQELQRRATAARDNLQKLSTKKSKNDLTIDNFALSAVTENNLAKVVACFGRLASSSTVLSECVQLYPVFRETLVNDLTSVYRTPQAQQSLQELNTLLTKF